MKRDIKSATTALPLPMRRSDPRQIKKKILLLISQVGAMYIPRTAPSLSAALLLCQVWGKGVKRDLAHKMDE